MKKSKKLLALLLTALLVVSLLPTMALAGEGDVATLTKDGRAGTGYTTIADAVEAFNAATEQGTYVITIKEGTHSVADIVIKQSLTKSLVVKSEDTKTVTLQYGTGIHGRFFMIHGASDHQTLKTEFSNLKFNLSTQDGLIAVYFLGQGNRDDVAEALYGESNNGARYGSNVYLTNCSFNGNDSRTALAAAGGSGTSPSGIYIKDCAGTKLAALYSGYISSNVNGIEIEDATLNDCVKVLQKSDGDGTVVLKNITAALTYAAGIFDKTKGIYLEDWGGPSAISLGHASAADVLENVSITMTGGPETGDGAFVDMGSGYGDNYNLTLKSCTFTRGTGNSFYHVGIPNMNAEHSATVTLSEKFNGDTTWNGTAVTLSKGNYKNFEYVAQITKDDKPTKFGTLAEAITAAQPGDTIQILPGTISGNFDVNKSLTFVGTKDEQGNLLSTLNAAQQSNGNGCFRLTTNNITVDLQDLNFTNTGSLNACDVVIPYSGEGKIANLTGCTVQTGFRYSIYYNKGWTGTVNGCTFNSSRVGVDNGDGTAVKVTDCTFNNVNRKEIIEIAATATVPEKSGNTYNLVGENVAYNTEHKDNNAIAGTYAFDPVNYVENGYVAVKSGDKWVIKSYDDACVAQIAGGAKYLTLDEAIEDAQSGDTIEVFPGTYDAITLPEAVNIKGTGNDASKVVFNGNPSITYTATTDGKGTGTITVENVTLNGAVKFKGNGDEAKTNTDNEALCLRGYKLYVKDCVFTNSIQDMCIQVDSWTKDCELYVQNTKFTSAKTCVEMHDDGSQSATEETTGKSYTTFLLQNKLAAFSATADSSFAYAVHGYFKYYPTGWSSASWANGWYSAEDLGEYYTDRAAENFGISSNTTEKQEATENSYAHATSTNGVWPAEAKIGKTFYSTLDEAIEAAYEGDTIELVKDVTIAAPVNVTKALSIDGNNFTLSLTSGKAIFNGVGNNGTEGISESLTVKNLNMVMNSEAPAQSGYAVIAGKGGTDFAISFENCSFTNMFCGAILNGCGTGNVAPAVTIKNSTFENVAHGVSFAVVDYAGTVTFTGNKMSGETDIQEVFTTDGYVKTPTVKVINGYYTADPTAYLASGYAVAGSNVQGYAYMVANVDLPAGGNENIAVTSEEPKVAEDSITGIDEGTQNAIKAAAKKTEVAGLATDALEEAAKVNADDAKTALTEASVDVAQDATVTVFAQTYLDVKPTAYSAEDATKVYTVDIKPMVQLIATTAANADDIITDAEDENAVALGDPVELKVNTPVVVTIPLPTGFAAVNDTLYVKHTKDNGASYLYKCAVQKDANDQLYIQFVNNNGFSEFEITTVDTSVASIVKGGSTLYYTSLSAAVAAVKDGETIELTANCGETVTVARAVSFALNKNGKTFSGSITPGANYKNNGTGNSYIFTYVAPSGGGGGVASYAVSAASAINGKVSVDKKNASSGSTVTITVAPDKGFTLETLTVKDAKGNEVTLTAVKTGETYTFKMPAGKVTVSATFMEDNTMLNFFVDVKADDYFYDAVLWAAKNGITLGVDDTHFAPMAITTRGQMVTFLWRAAGSPEPTATTCAFTDVKADEYYYKAILWAAETGLTKGTSDTTFSPDAEVSRGQTVTFLARLNGVKDDASGYSHNFADVKTTDYYNNAVAWAATNKITDGTSATTFSPNDDCLRGQIVTFLYRNFVK